MEQKQLKLSVNNLKISFRTADGNVQAVRDISFNLYKGETLAVVGESGSGKSVTNRAIMGILAGNAIKEGGEILYDGRDLMKISEEEFHRLRGDKIAMIFQDPMTALNPTMTVADQIAEAIRNHKRISKHAAKLEAIRMLETVRIPAERAFEYPHQFSGGMKQRVVIAMALACNPAKGSIQAQVLELMKDLKEKYDTSMIMITHDLGIVSEVCDKVAIIYAGEVVECGSLEHIYRNPQHPYTNGLFGSLPDISKDVEFLSPIEGLMPDPAALPAGCKFNPRCKYACPLCAERAPVLTETEPGHFVRCLIYENALDVKEVVKYE